MTSPVAATQGEFTQARIRLNEAGAELLWQLLFAERARLMAARRQASDEYEVSRVIGKLRELKRVQEELRRTITEQGWASENDGRWP